MKRGGRRRRREGDAGRGTASVRIRQARREEAVLLARLIRRAFATSARRMRMTRRTWPGHAAWTPAARVRTLMDEGFRYWILEEGGEARGCVASAWRPEKSAMHVRHLAVLPRWRRRGFGRRLMARVVADARRRGAPRVTLGIAATDRGLRRWYERLGFAVSETRAWKGMPVRVAFLTMEFAGQDKKRRR